MSLPATVERRSLVDSTIEMMKRHIAARAWRVGTRIPPEAELAALFGVGRNTVREAIRVLSAARMLEVRQGDGTYVRTERDPGDTLRALSNVALQDHLELQRMLEVEAARFAAQRATSADIKLLRKLLTARADYVHDASQDASHLEGFLDRDAAFHMAVANASHNEAIQALYGHFVSSMRRHTAAIVQDGQLPEPDLAAHQAIVDAIEAGNEVAAAKAAHRMLTPLIDRISRPQRRR